MIGFAVSPRTPATVSGPTSSHSRTAPARKRSATSVRGSMRTSPRTPCGPRMKPTTRASSLIDLEVDLGPIARRHHFQQRADGLGDTAAATDDLADVRFAYLKVELDEIAVELLGDDDGARILDQLLRDVLKERAHA